MLFHFRIATTDILTQNKQWQIICRIATKIEYKRNKERRYNI